MNLLPKKIQKNISSALISLFCLIFTFLIVAPASQIAIGNIFFGKIPSLYNVNLAQFFFFEASHPLFGKAYPYANHQLSRTYFIQGYLEESLVYVEKELNLYPEHTPTYYIQGLTLGYLNREKEAIDAFSKFIEYKPTSWAARNDKAWLQFRIGDIDGALETIEPVANNISNPWIQNTYGTLLLNKRRLKEAERAFILAKESTDRMTNKDWGRAYPGNDPRLYPLGLQAMRTSISRNLEIVNNRTLKK